MATMKINWSTTFDCWHNDLQSWFTAEELESVKRAVSDLPWPGKRAPVVQTVRGFAWDNVDFVEVQCSYHRGCWKKAVYRIDREKTTLICKDWQGEKL